MFKKLWEELEEVSMEMLTLLIGLPVMAWMLDHFLGTKIGDILPSTPMKQLLIVLLIVLGRLRAADKS